MPTKREIVGGGPPSDGLQWSDIRWDRIIAFGAGVGSSALYFSSDLFERIPEWTAVFLLCLSVVLVIHGVTDQSRQTALKVIFLQAGNRAVHGPEECDT